MPFKGEGGKLVLFLGHRTSPVTSLPLLCKEWEAESLHCVACTWAEVERALRCLGSCVEWDEEGRVENWRCAYFFLFWMPLEREKDAMCGQQFISLSASISQCMKWGQGNQTLKLIIKCYSGNICQIIWHSPPLNVYQFLPLLPFGTT